MSFKTDGRLPGLNNYLWGYNQGHFAGGKMKKEADEMTGRFILPAKQSKTHYSNILILYFRRYEKPRCRGPTRS